MDHLVVALSGYNEINLPSWGRCFWQDVNDGTLFLAYASGRYEVDFITSSDSGVTWSAPKFAFPVDDFSIDNNFDVVMDRHGEVHCGFKYAGSGCYQHLSKSGATWTRDGGARGFCLAADTGTARGFNGSLFSAEYNRFSRSYEATSIIHIVAKTQAPAPTGDRIIHRAVISPYSSYPAPYLAATTEPSDELIAAGQNVPPGPAGGYPIIGDAFSSFAGAEWSRRYQIHYNAGGTGIVTIFGNGDGWPYTYSFGDAIPLQELKTFASWTSPPPATPDEHYEGHATRVNFGPTMAFGKGPFTIGYDANYYIVNPVIASTTPVDDNNIYPGWDMLAALHEPNMATGSGNQRIVSIQSSTLYDNGVFKSRSPLGVPFANDLDGIPFITKPALPPDSGTMCDYSLLPQSGLISIYTASTNPDGTHGIQRMLCEITPAQSSPSTSTQFLFSSLTHPVSGIREFGNARPPFVGNYNGYAVWHGMKSLKRQPGAWKAGFSELVATVGSGTDGWGRIVIWDFDNSVEASTKQKIPAYSFNHIAQSGSTFVGISNATMANSPNMFDDDVSTSGAITVGDYVTLEFTKPTLISRVEIAWWKTVFGTSNNALFPEVDLYVSDDNVTFTKVYTYDELLGRTNLFSDVALTVRIECDYDGQDNGIVWQGKLPGPIIGKYLRIGFSGPQTGNRDVREIRVYGPSTTAGKITSTYDSWDQVFTRNLARDVARIEKFDSIREIESVPIGWRTSGDWDWFVRASGDYAKPSLTPGCPPPTNSLRDGIIPSGYFAGDTIGNNKGSAMRTAEWIPLNSSGLLEVDIHVGSNEIDEDGNSGRTVGFDTRYLKVGRGIIVPAGPEDDEFRFFITPEGSGITDGEQLNWHVQAKCFTHICDWASVKWNVPPGNYTLKWLWKRGSTSGLGLNYQWYGGEESVAWIDNIRGLDAPLTSVYGFIKGYQYASGSINGYMNTYGWDWIAGYIGGYFNFYPRHGYIYGAPNEYSKIKGFLAGKNEGYINGYTIAGDARSFPTGSIYGYLPTNSGTKMATHGYLLGVTATSINSFIHGLSDIFTPSGINGYVKVADGASTIYATVNAGATGTNDTIFGHMHSLFNESVAGYVLAPSGTRSTINAYLSPQTTSSIYGYIGQPIGSLTGIINGYVNAISAASTINGYMFTSGDLGIIHGYAKGDSNAQFIQGYLLNTGISGAINGYMNVLEKEVINGYLKGNAFASGAINAWMSGIGYEVSSVHGLLAGISGTASESIHSYMEAVLAENGDINVFLIGFDTASCPSGHGNVPLPILPTVTIPSGNFI